MATAADIRDRYKAARARKAREWNEVWGAPAAAAAEASRKRSGEPAPGEKEGESDVRSKSSKKKKKEKEQDSARKKERRRAAESLRAEPEATGWAAACDPLQLACSWEKLPGDYASARVRCRVECFAHRDSRDFYHSCNTCLACCTPRRMQRLYARAILLCT